MTAPVPLCLCGHNRGEHRDDASLIVPRYAYDTRCKPSCGCLWYRPAGAVNR